MLREEQAAAETTASKATVPAVGANVNNPVTQA
jgi:hypothetical protein